MFVNFSFDLVSNRGILTKIRLEDIHDTWVSDCREYWYSTHLPFVIREKSLRIEGIFF